MTKNKPDKGISLKLHRRLRRAIRLGRAPRMARGFVLDPHYQRPPSFSKLPLWLYRLGHRLTEELKSEIADLVLHPGGRKDRGP